ncbi:MAG: twin-arginine translocase TatA/TatE family subunit [Pseudomonadota bacterium]
MFSGISPASLLLILLIVVLVFGTRKLKGMGSDVGGAIKGFRKAMKEDDPPEAAQIAQKESSTDPIKQSSDTSTNG